MAKVKALTRQGRNEPLAELLRRVNPVMRGWTNYFRYGVSADLQLPAGLSGAGGRWLRRKHPKPTGSGSDAATSPGGGQPRAERPCSTP